MDAFSLHFYFTLRLLNYLSSRKYNPTVRYTYQSPSPWAQATMTITTSGMSNLANLPKYQEVSSGILDPNCPYTIGTLVYQKAINNLPAGWSGEHECCQGRHETFTKSSLLQVWVRPGSVQMKSPLMPDAPIWHHSPWVQQGPTAPPS